MTWNHPSPNMTSDGLLVIDPVCRPRVTKRTDGWMYYCPAHPTPFLGGSHFVVIHAAHEHADRYRLRE